MLRRLVLISLTLGAISIATLGGLGHQSPVHFEFKAGPRSFGYLNLTDGLVRIYLYRASEAIHVQTSRTQRRFTFRTTENGPIVQRILHARTGRIPDYAFIDYAFAPGGNAPAPTIRMMGVRCTTFLPVAAMLAFPVLAVVHDTLRRRKLGEGCCADCDYDLTGNTSGVCPECGRMI